MKEWTANINVNCPIDKVWYILDGDEEHLKALDPNIVKNEVIEETPERVGSRYLQEYKEGNRVMEYVVTVLAHKDTEEFKHFKIGFTLNKMFEITAAYDVKVIDENTTSVTYKVTNKPLKFFAKLMMFMMKNDHVMDEHMKKIKKLSEEAL